VSALLTAVYSFRLLEQAFWSDYAGYKQTLINHVKPTYLEMGVLLILGSLSIWSGYLFRDVFVGFGSGFFSNFSSYTPGTHVSIEAEFLPAEIKVLPLVFTAVAFEIENKFFECK
jgi:NADH-ubiquinone oxidoreductase chain 5